MIGDKCSKKPSSPLALSPFPPLSFLTAICAKLLIISRRNNKTETSEVGRLNVMPFATQSWGRSR